MCQSCVDLKKKDLIIEQLSNSRDNGKINKIHTEIEELRAEIKANNLSLKTELHEIKNKTFGKTTPPAEPKLPKEPSYKKPVNKEQYDGIRFRGTPELNSKSTRDRYEHDLKEVKAIMKNLKVFCNITDIKRLGKFSENKHRTLVVKIDSDYAKRLILLSLRKLKDYGKPVFISKELNPEEQAKENEMLQMRRTLRNQGTSAKSLRIRNLVLQKLTDKNWVDPDSNENEKRIAIDWLKFIRIYISNLKCKKSSRPQTQNELCKLSVNGKHGYPMPNWNMVNRRYTQWGTFS